MYGYFEKFSIKCIYPIIYLISNDVIIKIDSHQTFFFGKCNFTYTVKVEADKI